MSKFMDRLDAATLSKQQITARRAQTRNISRMSLRDQRTPDTRSYTTKVFDNWFKMMGWLFLVLVIIMPVVMTVYFQYNPVPK